MSAEKRVWSDHDYDQMSWHDNHVHGMEIRSGEHGAGELLLDLDYIVEWLPPENGRYRFRIAPATLTFRDVTDLRIDIDYAAATAALTPFSISGIEKEIVRYPIGATSYRWNIGISWLRGAIAFIARGFTQRLRAVPVVTSAQLLEPSQRAAASTGV